MDDIQKIMRILKKYPVKEAFLFGSYTDSPSRARDIDIAVSLRDERSFFPLSAALSGCSRLPVDLIPLEEGALFSSLVRRDGIKIHG